ncbi:hypothetical protein L596_024527 [Steinernema carpocapsae]|uniref:BTB domain-containing protein n=1 Tax=Steinernema carpocapsae TaxID=34508 RepID=A0A4U5MI60_STECR|nr:hypothetical protein L596_024527 [Steinernema carpocapsae]
MKFDTTELYVSKQLLSTQSSVFKQAFQSESQDGVLELPGVSDSYFCILLNGIYGLPISYDYLTEKNIVAEIVELAHRFQFQSMLTKIENVLTTLPNKEMKPWFKLADKYNFLKLRSKILSQLSRPELEQFLKAEHEKVIGPQKFSAETIEAILNEFVRFVS